MSDAVTAMGGVTAALNALSDWAKNNPLKARLLTDTAAVAGAGAVAVGAPLVALSMMSPALKMLGFGGGGGGAGGSAEVATELAAAGGGSALAGVLSGIILPAAIAGVIGSNYETPETEAAQDALARQRRSGAGGPSGALWDGYDVSGRPVPPPTVGGGAPTLGTPENPIHTVAQPPANPPPPPQMNLKGDVYLDGAKVGSVIATSGAKAVSLPPTGPTGPDPRMNLPMPGMSSVPDFGP